MNFPAIEVHGAHKAFAGHIALHHVDLTAEVGAIHGLLGPNGAGKTTLIRMLAGITAPDRGTLSFFGEAFNRRHIAEIGYLPEERGLYKSMKVGEQAMYLAQLRGMSKKSAHTALKHWFEKLEVDGWWNREIADLSKGMAQKVQFITTVLHKPKLLILDEPLSGFDPINAARIIEAILELKAEGGTTVLLSTHDMTSVEELCDAVTMVHQGQVVLKGKVRDLRRAASFNRLEVTFDGNVMAFTNALGFAADLLDVRAVEGGLHCASVALKDEVIVPEWLRDLSELVPIHACQPWQPSMRDLFLQAVSNSSEVAPKNPMA